MNRRIFLQTASAAALATPRVVRAADDAAKKLRVAVVALGRGMGHVNALLSLKNVEIAYLAEVDPKRLANGMKVVEGKQSAPCKGVKDFRTFLDDKELDAVFIATPNYWHTPAALLCMQAGKHVYVEKPGSQNPREAEMIVEAAQKYERVCQMGNQRRTWMKEAIEALHGGAIGKLQYGRAFYYNARGPIAQGGKLSADPGLDADLWQGPVPDERDMAAYRHYDWHWLWHWGNGELGNNGIHSLDILRWGLGVEYPQRITYNGGRYFHQDKQETPDTGTVVYDCGAVGMSWEQSSSHPRSAEKPVAEVIFYGDGGTFGINNSTWTVFDQKGAQTATGKGPGGGDPAHMGNFLDGIRGTAKLNSPIEEGQKSTMLCHLGNLAYRTGSMIHFDSATKKVVNNPEAMKLWARSYRKGWEPKV
jgi:predicted dehydrogenase